VTFKPRLGVTQGYRKW